MRAWFFVIVVVGMSCARPVQPPSPEVAGLLARVVEKCHALSSYSDHGSVSARNTIPGRSAELTFTTQFKRPDKLRFEWTSTSAASAAGSNSTAIWSDGADTWSSQALFPTPKHESSLGAAVDGATGLSLGSAHTISRLLTDSVSGFRLDQLSGVRLQGTEDVGGVDCVVVVGYDSVGRDLKVSIGKDDLLVRQVETTRGTGDVQVERRTDIATNIEVPDAIFR